MKLMAVLTLACGLAAAPLVAAGGASADPATCDGAACALFVKKNIVPTDPCQFQSRNPFGLDAKGSTFMMRSVASSRRYSEMLPAANTMF